jgi:dimethylamine/trimethylamine dehydrogenase
MGGRVLSETKLGPLRQWKRVADYRTSMLSNRSNVDSFTQSKMDVDAILELGANHVAMATGSKWRLDLLGIHHRFKDVKIHAPMMISPEQIMLGHTPTDHVLIFDDDHYYLGSALAEQLAELGLKVTLVTPAPEVSGWTHFSLEYEHIQIKLRELGVTIICNHGIAQIGDGFVDLSCVFVGTKHRVEVNTVVPVTSRISQDDLYYKVLARRQEWQDNGIKSVTRIGDCYAPGTIAMAVYAGHEFARNLDMPINADIPFRRENDFELGRSWQGFKT